VPAQPNSQVLNDILQFLVRELGQGEALNLTPENLESPRAITALVERIQQGK